MPSGIDTPLHACGVDDDTGASILFQEWVTSGERRSGLNPISINTALRCVRAYLHWPKEEGHRSEIFKVQFLKEEQQILNTFSAEQVQAFLTYKPKGTNMTRAHMVVCLLLDTGIRISEALGLKRKDIDMENMTMRVEGKGGKHRLVPFSCELRKLLYRYFQKHTAGVVFATQSGGEMTVRNLERDFKVLGKKVGITGVRMSPHTCRHSFACEYPRRGGNLEFLRRILGHTSILTTQKYLRSLGVEDLQVVHNELSLLSAKR